MASLFRLACFLSGLVESDRYDRQNDATDQRQDKGGDGLAGPFGRVDADRTDERGERWPGGEPAHLRERATGVDDAVDDEAGPADAVVRFLLVEQQLLHLVQDEELKDDCGDDDDRAAGVGLRV